MKACECCGKQVAEDELITSDIGLACAACRNHPGRARTGKIPVPGMVGFVCGVISIVMHINPLIWVAGASGLIGVLMVLRTPGKRAMPLAVSSLGILAPVAAHFYWSSLF